MTDVGSPGRVAVWRVAPSGPESRRGQSRSVSSERQTAGANTTQQSIQTTGSRRSARVVVRGVRNFEGASMHSFLNSSIMSASVDTTIGCLSAAGSLPQPPSHARQQRQRLPTQSTSAAPSGTQQAGVDPSRLASYSSSSLADLQSAVQRSREGLTGGLPAPRPPRQAVPGRQAVHAAPQGAGNSHAGPAQRQAPPLPGSRPSSLQRSMQGPAVAVHAIRMEEGRVAVSADTQARTRARAPAQAGQGAGADIHRYPPAAPVGAPVLAVHSDGARSTVGPARQGKQEEPPAKHSHAPSRVPTDVLLGTVMALQKQMHGPPEEAVGRASRGVSPAATVPSQPDHTVQQKQQQQQQEGTHSVHDKTSGPPDRMCASCCRCCHQGSRQQQGQGQPSRHVRAVAEHCTQTEEEEHDEEGAHFIRTQQSAGRAGRSRRKERPSFDLHLTHPSRAGGACRHVREREESTRQSPYRRTGGGYSDERAVSAALWHSRGLRERGGEVSRSDLPEDVETHSLRAADVLTAFREFGRELVSGLTAAGAGRSPPGNVEWAPHVSTEPVGAPAGHIPSVRSDAVPVSGATKPAPLPPVAGPPQPSSQHMHRRLAETKHEQDPSDADNGHAELVKAVTEALAEPALRLVAQHLGMAHSHQQQHEEEPEQQGQRQADSSSRASYSDKAPTVVRVQANVSIQKRGSESIAREQPPNPPLVPVHFMHPASVTAWLPAEMEARAPPHPQVSNWPPVPKTRDPAPAASFTLSQRSTAQRNARVKGTGTPEYATGTVLGQLLAEAAGKQGL